MKKFCTIIYMLLSLSFCAELVNGFQPQGDVVNSECVTEAKDEKKATEDLKILNPVTVNISPAVSAVAYSHFNTAFPKSCYREIQLPPPDQFNCIA